MLPHDFPRWDAVYQQTRRWLDAGVFEAIVHDLRTLLRLEAGRTGPPTAAIRDSTTLQSTPESGGRAGDDGHKRRKGSKLHAAVDTLGHLLALQVTPADAHDRAQVDVLAAAVQEATGETVELADVDQGYTGDEPADAAATHGIRLEVVKLPEAKHGFVLLAQALGRRARLRLGRPLPPPGPRLRTPAPSPGGPAFPRLRLPHAPSADPCTASPQQALALEHGTVVASDVVNAACAARDNFANCTQALGWMDFLKVIPASEIWMIQGVETALFSGSLPWGCSPSRSGSSRDAENEVSRSRLVLRSMVRYVAAAHMQRSSHVSALLAQAASSIRFGSRRSVR